MYVDAKGLSNFWDESADVSIPDAPHPLASATISILVPPSSLKSADNIVSEDLSNYPDKLWMLVTTEDDILDCARTLASLAAAVL